MESLSISSTEELNSLGQGIKSKSETIGKYLKQIETINNDLAFSWKGTAASSYCGRVEQSLNELKISNNTIGDTGTYLQDVSNIYREAEETSSTYTETCM